MRTRLPNLGSTMLRPCLIAIAVLGMAQIALACPTCKAGLGAHDPAHGDLVGAYMWSILFMMSMPFTLLASFSGYFYWLVRKARAAQTPGIHSQAPHSEPAFAVAQESASEAVGV
jgi:hypothetical protein